MLCFRLLEENDPAPALAAAVDSLREGKAADGVFSVGPVSFRQVPNAPFAYWVSEHVRQIFTELPAFEGEGRTVKQGLATADDFRFVRTAWETPVVCPDSADHTWFPFAKGGSYSPFYADVYLAVNWKSSGFELDAFSGSVLRNTSLYFRPGLTWPRRTQSGLALRAMPAGCVFADKGPAAFVESDDVEQLLTLFALATSQPFRGLVEIQMAFGSYEVGVIQRTALPSTTDPRLADLARQAWAEKRRPDAANLTSHAFEAPALARPRDSLTTGIASWSALLAESVSSFAALQSEIDTIVFALYGIGEEDRLAIETMLGGPGSIQTEAKNEEEDSETSTADAQALVSGLLDYLVGTTFGRWDIRYASGERQPPKLSDPFDPLHACPLGMLQGDDGLPLSETEFHRQYAVGRWQKAVEEAKRDGKSLYPLRISWSGILVDDENHLEDIVARVREAIEVIWKDQAEAIEQEACEILEVKSLRDYFRRPAGFFADHLKRHSKSRRQAPIYWPLSTESGRYTLWLYYHRLSDQTLFQCVTHFVKPKIEEVQADLARLRADNTPRTSIDDHVEFLAELTTFRDELLRITALPWKPNLDDGVLITASSLWKLFRLPKWQKDLKACWQKLEKGDYDWAHLAYTLYPDRVKKVCETDRSIAIAHNLERLCKVQPPKPKKKRGKKGQAITGNKSTRNK